MKRVLAIVPALIIVITAIPLTTMAAPSSWAQEAIGSLVQNGAMVESLNSEHQKPIQRDEFVAIFIRAIEATGEEIPISTTPFTDINNTPHKSAIEKAYGIGLAGGTSASAFNPTQSLTREQAAVFVTRPFEVSGYPTESADSFSDSGQISSWAKEGISLAVDTGMMNGVGGNNFSPKGSFTREQAFVVINNLLFSDSTVTSEPPVDTPAPSTSSEVREDLWMEVGGVRLNIGMTKDEVYSKLGQPQRTLMSEYGIPWHVYNSNYENFIMIGIDDTDTIKVMLSTAKTFNTPYGKFGDSNPELFHSSMPNYEFYRYPTSKNYSKSDPLMAVLLNTKSFSFEEITEEFLRAQEQVAFELLNGFRVAIGLNQLTWDEDAAIITRIYCIDMIENNYLAHTNSDGVGPCEQYNASNNNRMASEENLGKGRKTGFNIIYGFTNSYGHYLGLTDQYADGIGIGLVKKDDSFAHGTLLTREK